MKYFSCVFLVILFALLSCSENDNPRNNSLSGIYEARNFVDSLNLWVVSAYEFHKKGTYEYRISIRESEEGEDIGFNRIYPATYEWDGLMMNYIPKNGHGVPFSGNELFLPKNELVSYDNIVFDYFRPLQASLTFTESGAKMIYQEIFPESWGYTVEACEFVRR